MKPTKTTTQPFIDSINRSPLQRGILQIMFAFVCIALSPISQSAPPPGKGPPDGNLGNGNTAEGTGALFSLTTGVSNTAMGFDALFSNTTGPYNTAYGYQALFSNTAGDGNTATGFQALYSNTTGNFNTANGISALYSNTTGLSNTATGVNALVSNTTGQDNTANGMNALATNTIGSGNTANGFQALQNNTTGDGNTATGIDALFGNTVGTRNTADGLSALANNTTGELNTANGYQALQNNTTGTSNIALGWLAGSNLTTGDNNINIGNQGVAGESNTIRIGGGNPSFGFGSQTATFIAGIFGAATSGGIPVYIDSNGQLGTVPSSQRFKQEINAMDRASEAILSLRPVTFRYKKEIDPKSIPQFGLIAEQVEKINPDLVARDGEGKVYTVRYEAVNAMLLNEFLKEHRQVEQQEATIAQLKSTVAKQEATAAHQQKEIEALTAGLQKVSAQVELKQPSPQIVANSP